MSVPNEIYSFYESEILIPANQLAYLDEYVATDSKEEKLEIWYGQEFLQNVVKTQNVLKTFWTSKTFFKTFLVDNQANVFGNLGRVTCVTFCLRTPTPRNSHAASVIVHVIP